MKCSANNSAVLLVTAALAIGCSKPPPPSPAPPEVQVAVVLQRDVPIMVESIGQTLGSTEVEVTARAEGFLQSVDFKEGTFVKKGDLLYTIDPSTLEAALANAKGQLARAQADLARASQDVARYKPLVALNAIPRQQYDTAVSVERAASAAVDAAAAAAHSAEIDLGYTRIYAPIDGLVGKTEVKTGNLVGGKQNTLLTTVSNVDPIHVRFTIAEQDYLRYSRSQRERGGTPDPGRFVLILSDGSVHPQRGDLVFADRLVDPTTGTLLLEAAFPNPDKLVRSGQYARVRAAVDLKKGAILVPQRAVKELQATYTVAVVSGDDKVSMRTVKPGDRIGSLWVIDSGLAPGEKVVVEGLQKVREGVTVKATTVTIADVASAGASSAAVPAAPPAAAAPAAKE
ncbi:MAG: efflux RND transporter periplasmic adaptor subunit [Deltaproteobacteria bacterium]|nr:efflux RND transporter periplasmic adaptor subunit [Deltaproteobacteria bacterium]